MKSKKCLDCGRPLHGKSKRCKYCKSDNIVNINKTETIGIDDLKRGMVVRVSGGPTVKSSGACLGESGEFKVIKVMNNGFVGRPAKDISGLRFIYMGPTKEGPTGITMQVAHKVEKIFAST